MPRIIETVSGDSAGINCRTTCVFLDRFAFRAPPLSISPDKRIPSGRMSLALNRSISLPAGVESWANTTVIKSTHSNNVLCQSTKQGDLMKSPVLAGGGGGVPRTVGWLCANGAANGLYDL